MAKVARLSRAAALIPIIGGLVVTIAASPASASASAATASATTWWFCFCPWCFGM